MKKLLSASIMILVAFSIIFFTTGEVLSKGPIEISFNTQCPGPAQKSVYEPTEWWKDEIAKRTNGRVEFKIFYGAALAPPAETYQAVVKGICGSGETLVGYTAGQFLVTEAAQLPFGYPNSFTLTHVINDLIAKFKPKEWNDVVPLYFTSPPPMALGTVEKIAVRKAADIKGLTVRVPGATGAEWLKNVGGAPRVVPMPSVYEMLAKGVIDGQMSGPEAWLPFKFTEVCKYMTDLRFVAPGNPVAIIMNKKIWNKLSSEDQKIIQEVSQETIDVRSKTWDKYNDGAIKIFKSMPGKEFIELPADSVAVFKAAADAVIDKWSQEMKGKGYPADEYVEYIRNRLDYWGKQ